MYSLSCSDSSTTGQGRGADSFQSKGKRKKNQPIRTLITSDNGKSLKYSVTLDLLNIEALSWLCIFTSLLRSFPII